MKDIFTVILTTKAYKDLKKFRFLSRLNCKHGLMRLAIADYLKLEKFLAIMTSHLKEKEKANVQFG